jgi:hypothetical protein
MNRMCRLFVLCAAVLSLGACARGSGGSPPAQRTEGAAAQATPATEQVNPDAEAMAAFQERTKAYLALRAKARSSLPAVSDKATPDEIHAHQIALAARIRETRSAAKPGDIFDPGAQKIIRALMARVFGGAEGAQLKADIMDENPGRIKVAVNDRYPDGVPLSTVPPQVLAGLPKLPTELEYRFLGRALILLDTEAHLIVDFMDNAIP